MFLFGIVLLYSIDVYANVLGKDIDAAEINSHFVHLQIPFIENLGQTNKETKFYARTFAGSVVVTRDGEIIYLLPKIIDKKMSTGLVLREKFIDGIIRDIRGEKVSTTKAGSFIGTSPSNWRSNIPSYEFVTIGKVYENIEVKLRAYGNNVEKLLFLHPGADPKDIRIGLEGAKSFRIDTSGQLEMETDLGTVKFSKPLAYQEVNGKRTEISVSYVLQTASNGMIYGFQVGEYDKTKTLIIDPLLASTLIGGSRDEYSYSIALDSSGNVYVGGYTMSMDFPTISGVFTASNDYSSDVFVSKLNSDMTSLLASAAIGGNMNEYSYSLALDSSGNVYVGGYTTSMDFPTTPGVFTASGHFGSNVFISKLDGDLTSFLASTVIGGSRDDYAYSIALDSSGNIYVGGYTVSPDFPVTFDAFSTSLSGTADAFISKFNNDLTSLLASTFLGGSDTDYVRSMGVFSDDDLYPDNYIYVAGNTFSFDFPTTIDAYDSFLSGKIDTFISLLNKDLTFLISSTFLGGSENDYASSIVLDSAGNLYVTGDTSSPDFPTTPGAFKISLAGEYSDTFISKFDSGLMFLLASTYLGGSYSEYSGGIALGKEQAYGGTAALSWDAPITNADGTTLTDLAGYNVYYGTSPAVYGQVENVGNVMTYTINNLQDGLTYYFAVTAYDMSGNESGYSNEVFKTITASDLTPSFYVNSVFLTGSSFSPDFPVTVQALSESISGSADVFVSKLNSDLTAVLASTFLGGSNYDHGCSIAIDTWGDVYTTGNTYSSNFPVTSLNYSTKNNYTNYFIAKLDSNLSDNSVIAQSSFGADAISAAMVTVQGISILSPNGGEVLTSGSKQNIQWQTDLSGTPVAEVKLYYTKNSGKTWKLIKRLKGNNGTYLWNVPTTGKIQDKCLIKAVVKDSAGKSAADISDSTFTIQP